MGDDDMIRRGDALKIALAYASGEGAALAEYAIRAIPAADARAERDALRAKVAENSISEPHDPGDFVGDIFYGHPIKTTMGTHRWTGTEWVALPSEAEALAGLLAEARKEAATLRDRLARMEGALTLAANRLQRRAVDYIPGGRLFIETSEWANEARAALTDGGKDG